MVNVRPVQFQLIHHSLIIDMTLCSKSLAKASEKLNNAHYFLTTSQFRMNAETKHEVCVCGLTDLLCIERYRTRRNRFWCRLRSCWLSKPLINCGYFLFLYITLTLLLFLLLHFYSLHSFLLPKSKSDRWIDGLYSCWSQAGREVTRLVLALALYSYPRQTTSYFYYHVPVIISTRGCAVMTFITVTDAII